MVGGLRGAGVLVEFRCRSCRGHQSGAAHYFRCRGPDRPELGDPRRSGFPASRLMRVRLESLTYVSPASSSECREGVRIMNEGGEPGRMECWLALDIGGANLKA